MDSGKTLCGERRISEMLLSACSKAQVCRHLSFTQSAWYLEINPPSSQKCLMLLELQETDE